MQDAAKDFDPYKATYDNRKPAEFLADIQGLVRFKLKEFGIVYDPEVRPLEEGVSIMTPLKREKEQEFLSTIGTSKKDFGKSFYGLLYQLNELATEMLSGSVQTLKVVSDRYGGENKRFYPSGNALLLEMKGRFLSHEEANDFAHWFVQEAMRPMDYPEDRTTGEKYLHDFFEEYKKKLI